MNNLILNDFKNFQYIAKHYMIDINNHQRDQFKRYYEILLEWNKKINLISRKEENILEKHFLDSILFLPEIDTFVIRHSSFVNVCDIGSGGGFPAIPLAIMKPDWQFVLCESIKKKTIFLEHLIKELKMEHRIKIINARVETIGKGGVSTKGGSAPGGETRPNKNKYDLVTARAVDKLNVLIKYFLPLSKQGGYLLAFKSKDIDKEIKNAKKSIEKNKLKLEIYSKEINGIERKLIVLSNPGTL